MTTTEPETNFVQVAEGDQVADDFIATCKAFLESQNCTLWGRAWDIKSEETLSKGAEWLASEIMALLLFIGAEEP